MKKILTFGVFDYFHLGHLRLFKQCKKYADYLGKAKEHLDLGETEEYENKLEFLLQSGYDKESLENYMRQF